MATQIQNKQVFSMSFLAKAMPSVVIRSLKDFITDYFRNTYPEFKNSEQLWTLHKLYINKENAILNSIVSDYTFTAYKINEKSN